MVNVGSYCGEAVTNGSMCFVNVGLGRGLVSASAGFSDPGVCIRLTVLSCVWWRR